MTDVDSTPAVDFYDLYVEDLTPFPLNPRVHVDELALVDLKRNIERQGLLEPLIVRPTDSEMFEVVAGNRRLAALRELHEQNPARWSLVPVQIWNWLKDDDASAFRVAVTENVERESMNPYDETLALLRLFAMTLTPESQGSHTFNGPRLMWIAGFLKAWSHRVESSRQVLVQQYGFTMGQVEAAVSFVFKMRDGLKLSSFVNNRLPLLELPEDVQEALSTGRFPYAAAKEVGKVEDPEKRSELVALALNGMSYRQLIKQAKLVQQPAAEQVDDDVEFIERAKRVSKWLRKKPKLNQNERKQLDAAFRRIEDVYEK